MRLNLQFTHSSTQGLRSLYMQVRSTSPSRSKSDQLRRSYLAASGSPVTSKAILSKICQHSHPNHHRTHQLSNTLKNGKKLSTKPTQETSSYPKNASSSTTSCACKNWALLGPTKSTDTSTRTSSHQWRSLQSHTSPGFNAISRFRQAYTMKFAKSFGASWTRVYMNPPTHPTDPNGSASSRRTANHSGLSTALSPSIKSL